MLKQTTHKVRLHHDTFFKIKMFLMMTRPAGPHFYSPASVSLFILLCFVFSIFTTFKKVLLYYKSYLVFCQIVYYTGDHKDSLSSVTILALLFHRKSPSKRHRHSHICVWDIFHTFMTTKVSPTLWREVSLFTTQP